MNASLRIQISAFGGFHDISRISRRSVYHHRTQYYCTQSGRKEMWTNDNNSNATKRLVRVLFLLCVFSVRSLLSVSRAHNFSAEHWFPFRPINGTRKRTTRKKGNRNSLFILLLLLIQLFFHRSHSIRKSVEVLFYVAIIISWLFIMRGIFRYIS